MTTLIDALQSLRSILLRASKRAPPVPSKGRPFWRVGYDDAEVVQAWRAVIDATRVIENGPLFDETVVNGPIKDELQNLEQYLLTLPTRPAPKAIIDLLDQILSSLGKPAKSIREDGPVPPNGFRWRGKVHHPIAKGPFLVLTAAWANDGRCLHKNELAAALGDSEKFLPDSAVPSIRGKLTDFFTSHGIPLHASVKGLFFAIQDGPGRKRAKRKSR